VVSRCGVEALGQMLANVLDDHAVVLEHDKRRGERADALDAWLDLNALCRHGAHVDAARGVARRGGAA
jgi:hypothetical protein